MNFPEVCEFAASTCGLLLTLKADFHLEIYLHVGMFSICEMCSYLCSNRWLGGPVVVHWASDRGAPKLKQILPHTENELVGIL